MRHLFILLTFVLALAPRAAFADDPLAAAILNLDADKADAQLAETLTSVVRNEAMQVEKYQVVNKFPIKLTDVALLLNCSPDSPTCLKAIAAEVDARVLIYGHIRRSADSAYMIELNIFDVTNSRMINRLTRTLTDTSDPVIGFRKEIETFFAEERGQAITRLQIGANVDGAQIHIDDTFVGVAPLERKGLPAGTYMVRVTHPDYAPWERTVELGAGTDQTLWAQLEAPAKTVEPEVRTQTVIVHQTPVEDVHVADAPRGGSNWGAWSAVTVGALALGGSLGFGLGLEAVESTLEREAADGTLTEARYQQLYDRGENYELAHRILLGVGAVATVTGVLWLVLDRGGEPRAELGLGPSGVAARWRW